MSMVGEAYGAGIQVEGGELGSLAPWTPRMLWLRARVQPAADPAYAATAETLLSLARDYQERMQYEQVRILLIIPGGEVVYDHTFVAEHAGPGDYPL
jgi:hypothetical protein